VSSSVQKAVLVLTTIGADADGPALARTLVEEHLAACVNVLPAMTSVYRWKGRIEQDREQQLVIKTTAERVDPLQSRLRELNTYELPEFLVVAAGGGSAAYLAWVEESVRR
jgi:periplasmic divalent cation tolerance protein